MIVSRDVHGRYRSPHAPGTPQRPRIYTPTPEGLGVSCGRGSTYPRTTSPPIELLTRAHWTPLDATITRKVKRSGPAAWWRSRLIESSESVSESGPSRAIEVQSSSWLGTPAYPVEVEAEDSRRTYRGGNVRYTAIRMLNRPDSLVRPHCCFHFSFKHLSRTIV
jgi:hypothetical protein